VRAARYQSRTNTHSLALACNRQQSRGTWGRTETARIDSSARERFPHPVVSALPEPRCFAATTVDPLSRLAAEAAQAPDATQRLGLLNQLHNALREALASGRDDLLRHATTNVISPVAGLALLEALDQVIDTPAGPAGDRAARVFALPVVLVAAGLAGAEISGILPAAQTIARLLDRPDAIDSARTFGLSAVLCAETSLETDSPSQRYALLRSVESGGRDVHLDMRPAPIRLESADESVHLRFLVGSVVGLARAPSFPEAVGDIGTWGLPLSRALLAQLGQAGLSLLPLPRPPAGLMKALHEGRRAREEVALQAFVSRVLRRMRSEMGEPEAEVAALDSGAIGVRLMAGFDHGAEAHRWRLDALDDLADVTASILDLLADCRVRSVRVLERIVSDAEFLGD